MVIGGVAGVWFFLTTSVFTDRIGWIEVLLPINHNYKKFFYVLTPLKIKTQVIPRVFLHTVKKKPVKCTRDSMYCPIT